MDNKEFRKIRSFLGKTQEQLARWLCVSPKTIQSYEQGWRTVPSMIERQLLLFSAMVSAISIRSFQETNGHPCWDIKKCPDKWKDNCIVWELQIKQFCWFMNGTFCEGRLHTSWEDKVQVCRGCEVYQASFATDLASISGLQG